MFEIFHYKVVGKKETILEVDSAAPDTSADTTWNRDEPPSPVFPKYLTHKIMIDPHCPVNSQPGNLAPLPNSLSTSLTH